MALSAGGVCAAGFMADAAPLQRADVVANPGWVVHLDCDALRPTTVGHYVLSEMDKPGNKAKIAIFQALSSIDPRTQLHGVTLYGTGPGPENGVLMVYADFDADHLVNLAQAAKDYQSEPHGKNTIHSWLDDKKKVKNDVKPRIYAAIQGNHVIFSQREENVAKALDVADNKSPNLAGSHVFPAIGQAGNGHVIEAAAQKTGLPDSDPNAAILKLSQSVQLFLGESQKQINGEVTLITDNTEVAGHVLSIAQGLVALAKMQTDKPESAKVANAISLKQDDEKVIGTINLPAGDMVEFMKADAARKAAAKHSEQSEGNDQ